MWAKIFQHDSLGNEINCTAVSKIHAFLLCLGSVFEETLQVLVYASAKIFSSFASVYCTCATCSFRGQTASSTLQSSNPNFSQRSFLSCVSAATIVRCHLRDCVQRPSGVIGRRRPRNTRSVGRVWREGWSMGLWFNVVEVDALNIKAVATGRHSRAVLPWTLLCWEKILLYLLNI